MSSASASAAEGPIGAPTRPVRPSPLCQSRRQSAILAMGHRRGEQHRPLPAPEGCGDL